MIYTIDQRTKIVHNHSKVHKSYSTIGHEIKNDIFTNMTIKLYMKSSKCPSKFLFFFTNL